MAKRWLDRFWAFSFVAAAGVLAVLAFPHLASAYHLEAGGRALDNPSTSLEHLLKAIEWAPSNAQAYRLLAKAYQAQGDWPAAVEALTHYTELRPDSPLGHIELAELYEVIGAEMAGTGSTKRFADLVALLPQADVEAPGVLVHTPPGRTDDPEGRNYVAQTTFNLPPNSGGRPTLFMRVPSSVTYTLALPLQPAILRFGLGLTPQVQNSVNEGATFEVLINGERIFLEQVDSTMARQGWHERIVDLALWTGQEVALTLSVAPGLEVDRVRIAGWGEPQVVDARLPELEAIDTDARILEAWRRAGLTVENLLARGIQARAAQSYEESERWYKRATRLEPALGDPWYHLGLLYEKEEQWDQALYAYEQAAASERFLQVGRSDPYSRIGDVYWRHLEPPRPDDALAAYRTALALNEFGSVADAGNAHYLYGYALWEQKADPDDYIAEFQRATKLDPKHAWAHILLGLAIYRRDGDPELARTEILMALELEPQNKWARYHLGEIHRQEGRMDEAAAMYEQALQIDPDFEAARGRVQALDTGK